MSKLRFILMMEDQELGRYQTMKDIANKIGCSFQHVYKNNNGEFIYKKVTYKVIDRLNELV
jgi:hypothetical protein